VEEVAMLDLTSSLFAVTVFREGAMISRRAELAPNGSDRVRLVGLPLSLLDSTIAVRVEGPEPGPVVVDYRVGLRVNEAVDEGDLDRRLEQLGEERVLLESRRYTCSRLLAGLEALEPQCRPRNSQGAPLGSYQLESQLELLAFRRQEALELEQRLAELDQELKQVDESLQQLQTERSRQAPEARPEALEKTLVLTLLGTPGPGSAVVIEYRVPGARWAPAYSVDFHADLARADLTMRAMVAQHTGEDWTDVELTLSTADPAEWRDVPEWKALRIGRAQEPSGPRWFPPPVGTEALFKDYDDALATSQAAPTSHAPPPPPAFPARPAPEQALVGKVLTALSKVEEATSTLEMLRAAPPAAGGLLGGDLHLADKKRPFGAVARERSGGGGAAECPGEGGPPQAEPVLTLELSSLRFLSLRLAGADSRQRGRLMAVDLLEEYLEVSALTWSRDQLFYALGRAEEQAYLVGLGNLPAGYSFPQSLGGFDFSYQAQAKVGLRSSGTYHNLPVFHTALEAQIDYVCAPRDSQQVFRSASLANTTGRALPDGPADISVDGAFLHTTPLRAATPEARIRLGLGVDQSVKVSRQVSFKEGSSGLMGGTTELTHTITIEAVNHRSSELLLEVRERLPQPASEHKDEIKVLQSQVKPAWEHFEPEESPLMKSAYRWKLPLPPGQKVMASATYIIEMPSKYELEGGNRREPSS
jgi:hypothetical protein